MVPTDEARITPQMLDEDAPLPAIASARLAMLPPSRFNASRACCWSLSHLEARHFDTRFFRRDFPLPLNLTCDSQRGASRVFSGGRARERTRSYTCPCALSRNHLRGASHQQVPLLVPASAQPDGRFCSPSSAFNCRLSTADC